MLRELYGRFALPTWISRGTKVSDDNVLVFTAIDILTKDAKGVFEIEKHDLTLLGVFGIRDTLREGVEEAVA